MKYSRLNPLNGNYVKQFAMNVYNVHFTTLSANKNLK